MCERMEAWEVISYKDWTLANAVFGHRWQADAHVADLLFQNFNASEVVELEMEACAMGAFSSDDLLAIIDVDAPCVTDGWLFLVKPLDLRKFLPC